MGHDVGEVFIDDVVLNLVEAERGSEESSDSSAFDGLAFSADSTVEAFEVLRSMIADTTDGANGNCNSVQNTTSKNYAGATVGDLTGNLVDSIHLISTAEPLRYRAVHSRSWKSRSYASSRLFGQQRSNYVHIRYPG